MTEDSASNKEFKFLKGSGFLTLAIGLFFITDSVRVILFEFNDFPGFAENVFHVSEAVFLLATLFVLFKNINVFNSVPGKTSWLGRFDDEFLNYINMRGYQYAFNLAIITLFIGMFAGEIWPEATANINLHIFCKTVFAISLIGYSIPVLRDLYGESS